MCVESDADVTCCNSGPRDTIMSNSLCTTEQQNRQASLNASENATRSLQTTCRHECLPPTLTTNIYIAKMFGAKPAWHKRRFRPGVPKECAGGGGEGGGGATGKVHTSPPPPPPPPTQPKSVARSDATSEACKAPGAMLQQKTLRHCEPEGKQRKMVPTQRADTASSRSRAMPNAPSNATTQATTPNNEQHATKAQVQAEAAEANNLSDAQGPS